MTPKSLAIPFIPVLFAGVDIFPIYVLAVLIGIDIITGIVASISIDGRSAFKSSKAIWGIIRKMLYILIPMSIAFVGSASSTDLTQIASYSMLTISLFEFVSIVGNIASIGRKERVPEFDAIGGFYKLLVEKAKLLTGLK